MTYPSSKVNYINLSLKNKQPCAMKDTEKSRLDAPCLSAVTRRDMLDSWLHSMTTQTDIILILYTYSNNNDNNDDDLDLYSSFQETQGRT